MPSPALPLSLLVSPSTLHPSFLCPACSGVLLAPVLTCEDEQHVACLSCADPEKGCKGCGDGKAVEVKNGVGRRARAVDRAMAEVRVRCRFGCGWEGAFSSFEVHEASCPLRRLPCPNAPLGCLSTFPFSSNSSQALKEHKKKKSGCPLQKIACSRTYETAEGREETCGKVFLRKEREEHEEVCEFFSCSTPDCPTRGTQALLALHEPHCALVDDALCDLYKLEDENEDLSYRLDEKSSALAALEEDLDDTRDMLDDAEGTVEDLATQVTELESTVQAQKDELGKVKETLGEVQGTSCAKDSRIRDLEEKIKDGVKERERMEKEVEEEREKVRRLESEKRGWEREKAEEGKKKKKVLLKVGPARVKVKFEANDEKKSVVKPTPAALAVGSSSSSSSSTTLRNSTGSTVSSSSSSAAVQRAVTSTPSCDSANALAEELHSLSSSSSSFGRRKAAAPTSSPFGSSLSDHIYEALSSSGSSPRIKRKRRVVESDSDESSSSEDDDDLYSVSTPPTPVKSKSKSKSKKARVEEH
ncbi:hypothetical protein JCM8547_002766 [Rhodosporidiobolus lusitaniae]